MCSCPRFRSPGLHTRLAPEEVATVDNIISVVYQCNVSHVGTRTILSPEAEDMETWHWVAVQVLHSAGIAQNIAAILGNFWGTCRVLATWTRVTSKVSRLPGAATAVASLRLHLPLGRVLAPSHLGHQEQQAQLLEPHASAFRHGAAKKRLFYTFTFEFSLPDPDPDDDVHPPVLLGLPRPERGRWRTRGGTNLGGVRGPGERSAGVGVLVKSD